MGWIAEIGEALKGLVELEKVGIFCFMIVIISSLFFKDFFTLSVILYSMGIIILFLHAGLHRTKLDKSSPDPNNVGKTIYEHVEGYDFSSILTKKHPYNNIRSISYFFIILGTISLILEYILLFIK